MFKELIRRALFNFVPSEMTAESGTIKFKFLNWLYGSGEPMFNCWYPEDKND